MPTDFHTRPALTNGVSRQAPSLRLESHAEEQKNFLSDVSSGLIDRPPAKILSSPSNPAFPTNGFFHGIERDTDEKYVAVFDGAGAVRIFDNAGVEKTVNDGAGGSLPAATQAYLTTTGSAREQLTAISIGDYTFVVNREKTVSMDSADTSAAYGNKALIWFRQTAPETEFALFIKHTFDGDWQAKSRQGGGDPAFATTITTTIDVTGDTAAPTLVCQQTTTADGSDAKSTKTLAGHFRDLFHELVEDHFYATSSDGGTGLHRDGQAMSYWQSTHSGGSTVWLENAESAQADGVRFSSADGRGNEAMKVAHVSVESLSDLPGTGAPNGFSIKVASNDESDVDDWYVTWDGTRWTETLGPNVVKSFDSSTMPHVIIRQSDGTFQCGPCDGNNGRPSFAPRTVGDLDSVPDRGFVGKKIQGMALYKNRLAFVYQDGVSFSEAGEFFNLFPTTVRQILASDAIDIKVDAGSAAPVYRHAIPFDQILMMWSDTAQAVVSGTDIFSGDTVSADLATEFDANLNIKPMATGQTFLFKAPGDRFWEYSSNPQGNSYGAIDITAHIPGYLPMDLSWGVVSRSAKLAVFGSPTYPSKLYVYRYFYDGDAKLQSSWSTWEFDQTVLIKGGHFFDNKLMLAVQIQGQTVSGFPSVPTDTYSNAWFELDMDRPNQTGFDYPVHLDAIEELTVGTYTPGLGHQVQPTYLTHSTLSSMMVVGSTNAGEWKGREIPIKSRIVGLLYLDAELPAGTKVLVGFTYSREYEPTRFDLVTNVATGLSRGTPEPTTNSRVQLRRVKVQLKDAGHLKATVKRNGTQVSEKVYTPVRVGDAAGEVTPKSTDEFEIDIGGNAKEVSLVLSNDSFLPCGMTAISWEALYHNRSNPRR